MNTFKLLILVIYLTTLVDCFRVEHLCNKPNWRRQWGVVLNKAEQCKYGVVGDICKEGFVCRKGIGEHCGGRLNYAGVCGRGLSCIVKQLPTNPGTCQKYNLNSNLPLCTKDRKTKCRLAVSSPLNKPGKTYILPTILYNPQLHQSSNISRKPNKQNQLPGIKLPQKGNKRPSTGKKRPAINPQSTTEQPQVEVSVSESGKAVTPVVDDWFQSAIKLDSNATTTPSPSYASIILNGLLKAKKNSSAVSEVSRSGENVSAVAYSSIGNSSNSLFSLLANGLKHIGQPNASSVPQNVDNGQGVGSNESMVGSEKNVSSIPLQNVDSSNQTVDSNEKKDNSSSQQIKGSSKSISLKPEQIGISQQNASSNQKTVDSTHKKVDSNQQKADSNEQNENSTQQTEDSSKSISSIPEQVGTSQQNASSSQKTVDSNQKKLDFNKQEVDSNKQNVNSSQQNVNSDQQNVNSSEIEKNKADANPQNSSSEPTSNPATNSKKSKSSINWLKVFESLFGLKSKIESEQANQTNSRQMPNLQRVSQPNSASPISDIKVKPNKLSSSSTPNSQEEEILNNAILNSNEKVESDKASSSQISNLKEPTKLNNPSASSNSKAEPVQADSSSKQNFPNKAIHNSINPTSNLKTEPEKASSSQIPKLKETTMFNNPSAILNSKAESVLADSSSKPNLPDKAIPNSAPLTSKAEPDKTNSNALPTLQKEAILTNSSPSSNIKTIQANSNSKPNLPQAAKFNSFTLISNEKEQLGQTDSNLKSNLQEEAMNNSPTPVSKIKAEPEKTRNSNFPPEGNRNKINPNSVPELKQVDTIQTRNFNSGTNQNSPLTPNYKSNDTCRF